MVDNWNEAGAIFDRLREVRMSQIEQFSIFNVNKVLPIEQSMG